MNIVPILALVVAAVVGLVVPLIKYLYRNQIAFDTTSIIADLDRETPNPAVTINHWHSKLRADTLSITNFGIRNLEAVELHFEMPEKPFYEKLDEPTSLSRSAITTEWRDGQVRLSLPVLPRGERVEIDFMSVGGYVSHVNRLRGTGGAYKVVSIQKYNHQRQKNVLIINTAVQIMATYLFIRYVLG